MKILSILCFLFLSCINNDAGKTSKDTTKSEDNDSNSVKTVRITPGYFEDKTKIKSKLITTFSELKELKASDIQDVKLISTKSIKTFGQAKVYKVSLSDQLPEVYTKTSYVIVSEKRNCAAYFLLDTMVFIKQRVTDASYSLGGIEKIKAKGYFKLFDYQGTDKFVETLNTLTYCENGLAVFNNSLDCTSYLGGQLLLKNIDVNNDGLLDIRFSGTLASYCSGLETGYGREDRKPITKTNVILSFLLTTNAKKQFTYKLVDKDSMCKKLGN